MITSETSGEYVADRLRSCRGFTVGDEEVGAPQDLDLHGTANARQKPRAT